MFEFFLFVLPLVFVYGGAFLGVDFQILDTLQSLLPGADFSFVSASSLRAVSVLLCWTGIYLLDCFAKAISFLYRFVSRVLSAS